MMYHAGDSSRRERKGGEPPFFDGGSSEGAEGGTPSFGLQSEERKNKRSVSEAESDSCKTQRVLQGKKQG